MTLLASRTNLTSKDIASSILVPEANLVQDCGMHHSLCNQSETALKLNWTRSIAFVDTSVSAAMSAAMNIMFGFCAEFPIAMPAFTIQQQGL